MRPTTRGAGVVGLWLVTLGLVVALPSAALLGLWAALGVPLVAGPVICGWRKRSVAHGATIRATVAPGAVPLAGSAAALVSVRTADGGRWTELRVDPAVARWVRSSERARPASPARRSGMPLAPPLGRALLLARSSARTGAARLPAPTYRRGVYRLEPLALWVHDPLGLVGAVAGRSPAATVAVYPAATAAAPVLRRPDGERANRSRPTAPAQARGAGELIGLRPYRPGDRLALVHWRRAGTMQPLLTRQLVEDRTRPPRVVVDDRASVHRRSSFEVALGAVTAMVEQASAGALELGALTGGPTVTMAGGRPTTEVRRWLALVQPRRPAGRGAAIRRPVQLRSGDVVVTTATAAPSLEYLVPPGVQVTVAG